MNIKTYDISGVFTFQKPTFHDDRGFLQEFINFEVLEQKLNFKFKTNQSLFSYNKKANTIRGLHYQTAPFEQAKIVSCVKGGVLDIIVDLRENSETYMKHLAFELSDKNNLCLYVPKGFAHGYQTLEDDVMFNYLVEGSYSPEHSKTMSYKDTRVSLSWKAFNTPVIISDKDNI
jgi:dTDP-4-dehydrorhamnose 3,5-epimerase